MTTSSIVRFEPVLRQPRPTGDLMSPSDTGVVAMLRRHGLFGETGFKIRRREVYSFRVDSAQRSTRVFQGHHEMRVYGNWNRDEFREMAVPTGMYFVNAYQSRGLLVQYLLEPVSDDGLATWNFFDSSIKPGAIYPILRVHLIQDTFVNTDS